MDGREPDGDWRGAWRSLPNLLPPERIVAHAALGTKHPDWETSRAASYPDRLVLAALSMEHELRAGMARAGIGAGMRVLDAACGPGTVSRLLLEQGAAAVVGIDLDPAMVAMARQMPVPDGREQRLTFQEADVTQPLPFADASFDAVWFGDVGFFEAVPELVRVLRPGGRLVVKSTGLAFGRTYAWDRSFESRIIAAQQAGTDAVYWPGRCNPGSDRGSEVGLFGRLRDAASWQSFAMWTDVVERFAPLTPLEEQSYLQSFGLFSGAFIKDTADPADWAALARLYDPAAPEYLFRRPDGHFLTTLTFAVCEVAP
jgi:SAM-dependent methyltransferase